MITPTPEQDQVIRFPLAPLRVAAGAGTGKTSTIAFRIVHLVTHVGIEPERVLGITFTNKAAAELADRIRQEVAGEVEPGREVEIHTYHGFAAQILREFGALVGVERKMEIITPTFSRQLLNRVVATTPMPGINPGSRGTVEDLRRLGSALGDNLLDPDRTVFTETGSDDDVDDDAARLRDSLLVGLRAYQQEKKRLGAVDYSDLIVRSHDLVTNYPEVAAEIRDRYQAVMLDEYQDTNPGQRQLLRALFPAGFPVMAVGDIDQTIYEWRGASPHNFEHFPDHFPDTTGRPAVTLPLTVNRRSMPNIIEVANVIREQTGSNQLPLRPLPGTIGGEVVVTWHADAVAEADDLARRIQGLSHQYLWKQMAVLFRKNKDMILVHDALRAAGIPVEVANLGGLLGIPEVSDVHAWLRIISIPEDSPALYRILMGSRYRFGIGDLVHLARWAKGANRLAANAGGNEDSEEHGPIPTHTLLEAIDHLDEIPGLRPAARSSLERFRMEYRDLLQSAQGVTLVELSRRVLDRIGAWDDLTALPDNEQLTARLNLYRFLDLTEDWSPLEGEPSLDGFLRHLDSMAEEQSEELDTARLSGEDAVTLVTVHRAKGLEWEAVFLPACYKANFPSGSGHYDNPVNNGRFLPYQYRLDRDWLPPIGPEKTLEENREILREHHLRQEWRIAYVAVTRAKQRLFVSGASWYGHPEPRTTIATPSPLWDLVARHPVARVESQPTGREPERPELLRFEPPAPAPDPLFENGWDEALRSEIEHSGSAASSAESLGVDSAFADRVNRFQQILFDLPIPEEVPAETTGQTSVTGLVTFASCPQRFFWSEVDRLPRKPNPPARRGTEVHRAIELFHRGQIPLDDFETVSYDRTDPNPTEELAVDSMGPVAAFEASRFASSRPFLVEHPFNLTIGGVMIRGRIDAVYEPRPGLWEIVDFKSGKRSRDPAAPIQLEAYAVAARDGRLGKAAPADLTVTFAYLGGGLEEVTQAVDEAWLARARQRLDTLTTGINEKQWNPSPSSACRGCDFLQFCPAGKQFLAEGP